MLDERQLEMTDALFVVKEMHEEYRAKVKKLCMCFVETEKVFDRVPSKVIERAIKKKGLSEVILRTVMSLHKGACTKARVGMCCLYDFSKYVTAGQSKCKITSKYMKTAG